MICPKCGFDQPDAPECKKCGILVAKYRPREPRPSAPPPLAGPEKGTAPPPPPPPPQEPPDASPGWARGSSGPPPSAGASRYTSSVDRGVVRQVQAQAATKRFLIILVVAGLIGLLFAATGSLIKAYGYRTKLELDVTQDASEMANMLPDGVRKRVLKHAEQYGFKVKDDRVRIAMEAINGKPLAQELLGQGGITVITAKVTIELTVLTRILGLPVNFPIKASSTITRRAVVQDFRRWAADEYGEGKTLAEPEPAPEPAPEPIPEAPPEMPEPPYVPPQEGE